MPDWFAIVLLGIIEGITEFLPVSSTGHLLIAEHWLPHQSELFNVVIQSGAVLAVIPLFHKRFHQFLFRWTDPATKDYLAKVIAAFVITGIGGVLLKKFGWKLEERLLPIAVALVAGGVAFLLVEQHLKGKQLRNEVTWTMAVLVGFAQLVAAVFPGSSRSGTTIICCLLLGLARPAATEFCFLVGIPTMLAAGGLEMVKALHHPVAGAPAENWPMLALGFIVSAVVSFIAVKWLLRYVQSHTFNLFGWYRIAAGLAIFELILHTASHS
ncbi:MAG: undecaprenyl-diphosphate phosphatase [Verrucomicrobiota bacterium]